MSDNQEDLTQFWAVGSSLTGKKDHTKFFIENNIWEDEAAKNGDPVNKEVLDTIKKGDYLLMKTSSKKESGPGRTFTKLKAVGKVVGRVKDNYYTFFVAWDKRDIHTLPKEFNGIWYSKVVEPVKDDEMLRYARKIIRL